MLKHKQWEVGLKLQKKLIFSSINHRIRRFNVVNLVGKKESSSFRYSIADTRCREFQGHYISRARNWEDHRLAKFAIRNLSCNVWMEEIPADESALLYWLIVFQKKRKKKFTVITMTCSFCENKDVLFSLSRKTEWGIDILGHSWNLMRYTSLF